MVIYAMSSERLAFLVVVVLAISVQRANTQAECRDTATWCNQYKQHCSAPTVRESCERTCGACSSDCQALNCSQRCVRTNGILRCACHGDGYLLDADGITCNDINECTNPVNPCASIPNSYCANNEGSYVCVTCALRNRGTMFNYYTRASCCTLNSQQTCGKSSTNTGRIVGGKNARIRRWPWMAFINVAGSLCGGSLITERYLITAAHCVQRRNPTQILVRLGIVNTSDTSNVHAQNFGVTQIIIHPNYENRQGSEQNDIALVRLDRDVLKSEYVYPVCLPNGEEPKVDEHCFATGYGATSEGGSGASILQEISLPIAINETCVTALARENLAVIPQLHICAGYPTANRGDACQGDSGGPLMCQRCRNCDWYLAGITSFGRGCARAGLYGVYTRVTNYEQWISDAIGTTYQYRTCTANIGTWNEWDNWGDCSNACGGGTRMRTRTCPSTGGPCQGSATESEACSGEACGTWSDWGVYSNCDVTCGGGTHSRSRTCNGGTAGQGGCPGSASESKACNPEACPVWGGYTGWTTCSLPCGGGTQSRTRTCTNGSPGQQGCIGSATESQECNVQLCGTWSKWGDYSNCDVTCGGGTHSRSRTCNGGTAGQGGCPGSASESKACNPQACPVWGEYTGWTTCSQPCNGGTQSRTRTCANGSPGQQGCTGSATESQECNVQLCGTWSKWGDYSDCDVTCGGGTHSRSRACNGGTAGQGGCPGSASESKACNPQACPGWGGYTGWTTCSQLCGGGTQSRTRTCTNGSPGQQGCIGSATESQECNVQLCGTWSKWGDYSSCDVTCGGGMHSRSRTCNGGTAGQGGCPGSASESKACNPQACPGWGEYTGWTTCSQPCGGGTQSRTRTCTNGSPGQQGCTGSATESQNCNTNACGTWSDWVKAPTPCSETCGGGTQRWVRTCTGGTAGQGGCPGSDSEVRPCNLQDCPVGWTDWSEYGNCLVTCGEGTQIRTRMCQSLPDSSCPGRSEESRPCSVNVACPRNSNWGQWENWSGCSQTCNGGVKRRIRSCQGGVCLPSTGGEETRVCNPGSCPEPTKPADCRDNFGSCGLNFCSISFIGLVWCKNTCDPACQAPTYQAWGVYDSCTATCGYGFQERVRGCIPSRLQPCNAILQRQKRDCNLPSCPTEFTLWTSWTECTRSCGGGKRERSRTCPTGGSCPADSFGTALKQMEDCSITPCPRTWNPWGGFGSCSHSCGGGTRSRSRTCQGGSPGEVGCEGVPIEEEACGTGDCPGGWNLWGEFSDCSVTCGSGQRTRERTCSGTLASGCTGPSSEMETCTRARCPDVCSGLVDTYGGCSFLASLCNQYNLYYQWISQCHYTCCKQGQNGFVPCTDASPTVCREVARGNQCANRLHLAYRNYFGLCKKSCSPTPCPN